MIMWQTYALLSAIFAALTAIFVKLGIQNIDSNLATAIRAFFILCMLLLIVFCNGTIKDIRHLPHSAWLFLFLSAIATGLSWLFYFKALQLGEVARVAPVDKLSVPLAVLFAFLFLGEKVGWQIILGASLVTAGSLILLL